MGAQGRAADGGENVSAIDEVVEAVIALIDPVITPAFKPVTRGALGTSDGITCEVGPTTPAEMYLDKNTLVPLDLTLNGKHANLKALSGTLNSIHAALTRRRVYPSGTGWEITDIKTDSLPQIIGRENDNRWLMASGLTVEFYWRGE